MKLFYNGLSYSRDNTCSSGVLRFLLFFTRLYFGAMFGLFVSVEKIDGPGQQYQYREAPAYRTGYNSCRTFDIKQKRNSSNSLVAYIKQNGQREPILANEQTMWCYLHVM